MEGLLLEFDQKSYLFETDTFNIYPIDKDLWSEDKKSEKKLNSYRQIFDYSNYIDIKEFYVSLNTKENRKTIDKLINSYVLTDTVIKKFEIQKMSTQSGADITGKPYQVINDALDILLNQCKNNLTVEQISNVTRALQELEQLSTVQKRNVRIENCSCIKEIFAQIENHTKKYTCCNWGISKLYISDDGRIYNCKKYRDRNLEKSFHSLGMRFIVEEKKVCAQCCMRYLCGGLCETVEDKKGICKILYSAFQQVILKYIIDKEE